MSETGSRWAGRAAELREAFDRTFVEPLGTEKAAQEDFLAIRLGSAAYAIRFAEIAGMVASKQITRVPGPVAALVGIAGFRGAIVPVYHLGALLRQPTSETPRWLVLASGAAVAFAFDIFDGHLRIPRTDVIPHDASEHRRSHVRDFLGAGGVVRPIVDLTAVLDGIKRQSPALSVKEDL